MATAILTPADLLAAAPAIRAALWRQSEYEPWLEQRAAHVSPARVRLVAGGERAGKSRWTASEIETWLPGAGPDALFWIVGPSYELARPEFDHLQKALARQGMIETGTLSMPKQGMCSLRTWTRAVIVTRSSRDVETLAGQAPNGIAMVEAAQQTYETFLRLRGRVAETRGPLILSGTFEGSLGWYPELWQRWQADNTEGGQSFSIPTWANRTVYPGGRQDPEILALEATYPADVFQERFGAIPCPPATLVFKEFQHTLHVKPLPFNPRLPVQLWIDPGYAHRYAVNVVQIAQGGAVNHIDELWEVGTITSDMIRIARGREWWPQVQSAVMCWGGTQHQAMESPQEVWEQEARIRVFAQPVGIPDGIERHRTYLINPATKQPRMFYDPKCKGSIWEYGQYRYNEVKPQRPIRELPIDRDNDALKATAYGLVANFGYVGHRAPPKQQLVFSRRRGDRGKVESRAGWEGR